MCGMLFGMHWEWKTEEVPHLSTSLGAPFVVSQRGRSCQAGAPNMIWFKQRIGLNATFRNKSIPVWGHKGDPIKGEAADLYPGSGRELPGPYACWVFHYWVTGGNKALKLEMKLDHSLHLYRTQEGISAAWPWEATKSRHCSFFHLNFETVEANELLQSSSYNIDGRCWSVGFQIQGLVNRLKWRTLLAQRLCFIINLLRHHKIR